MRAFPQPMTGRLPRRCWSAVHGPTLRTRTGPRRSTPQPFRVRSQLPSGRAPDRNMRDSVREGPHIAGLQAVRAAAPVVRCSAQCAEVLLCGPHQRHNSPGSVWLASGCLHHAPLALPRHSLCLSLVCPGGHGYGGRLRRGIGAGNLPCLDLLLARGVTFFYHRHAPPRRRPLSPSISFLAFSSLLKSSRPGRMLRFS
jgi:hypothetical protein